MPKPKPLREQLQEIVNANTVQAVAAGFREIDRHAAALKVKLKSLGLAGLDDLIDHGAHAIKKKAAELATGRPQP